MPAGLRRLQVFRLSGQIAALLPFPTVIEHLVQPAAAMGDAKARNDLLAAFLDAFAREMVDGNRPIDDGLMAVWRAASTALFETARREAAAATTRTRRRYSMHERGG